MAALTRRTLGNLLTEFTNTVGGQHYPGFSARAQQWFQEAYFQFALSYNHYELQDEKVQTVVSGASSMPLPDNAYSVLSVAEVDSTLDVVQVLQNRNEILRQGMFNPSAGAPTQYARSGRGGKLLQLERPVDEDRSYRIDFYRIPNHIDFAATGGPTAYSELAEVYDSALVDYAVARAGGKLRADDLIAYSQALIGAFMPEQAMPSTLEEPPADLPETSLTNRPRGNFRG